MVPRPPALETAAGRRASAAIGAETIGCSIPSNSHTGVCRLIGWTRSDARLTRLNRSIELLNHRQEQVMRSDIAPGASLPDYECQITKSVSES